MILGAHGNEASRRTPRRLQCQARAVNGGHEGRRRATGSTKATLESQLVTHKLLPGDMKVRAHRNLCRAFVRLAMSSPKANAGPIDQEKAKPRFE